VREHHWRPSDIDGLYFDEEDHHGIIHWYKDQEKVNEELEKIRAKK